ncbi:MAG: T9SS type A sorting domain-containing protein [Bacteroidota bacterium]
MSAKKDPPMPYHSPEEIALFQNHTMMTQLDSGQYFHHPVVCQGCHGFDSLGLANIDANGHDVNLYDDWSTSMMALSAKDPFWKAKVTHEMQVNPAHANELQTLCTSCHAPMGHYTAKYHGEPFYTLADLYIDTIGLAGVACMGCHSIGSDGLGSMFSGNIPYDTNKIAYGPFDNPMLGPMQLYAGLTPTKADHVSEGRMCSSCHTLINQSVDLSGNPTGTSFIEQATFHEWENSNYPASEIVCQSCHMPQINDPIKIANGYTALPGRSPFNLHSFAGANSFMVNLIKTNKNSLEITASDADFDSTLVAINKQLTQNSVNLTLQLESITSDTAYINVSLLNKAGHKFPTGYPSRRAVLQLLITKANGDTLFASGTFDSSMEVNGINTPFEPHYNFITDPLQVQIYEMVMGDVNGDKTTVLERGYSSLKDNRIPPAGFSTSFANYDTCLIIGDALTDADFNHINSVEGSGTDVVHYHIPMNGYNGSINVTGSLYYQTLPQSFLAEMINYQSAEIDSFMQYYNAADKSVILTGRDTLLNIAVPTGITENNNDAFHAYPSYSKDGIIHLDGIPKSESVIKIYSSDGHLFYTFKNTGNLTSKEIRLPETSGIYFVCLQSGEKMYTVKIFRE